MLTNLKTELTYAKVVERFYPKHFNCAVCHESFHSRVLLNKHKTGSHPDTEQAEWERKTDREV